MMPCEIVYISGPMASDPDYRRKFEAAERELRGCGFVVINPAKNPEGLSYAAYMRLAIAEINECDTLYMLPGWENSRGARAEKAYAESVGKNIRYFYL
jgi:hypothetical protein